MIFASKMLFYSTSVASFRLGILPSYIETARRPFFYRAASELGGMVDSHVGGFFVIALSSTGLSRTRFASSEID